MHEAGGYERVRLRTGTLYGEYGTLAGHDALTTAAASPWADWRTTRLQEVTARLTIYRQAAYGGGRSSPPLPFWIQDP